MALTLIAPVAALQLAQGFSSGSRGSSSLTRRGFLLPRRQHGRAPFRGGEVFRLRIVATAGFKNGDVYGDKRGYRNGHGKGDQHPPTTKGVALNGEETPSGGGVVSEGLFASLDDGIVDAFERDMSSSASSNVVPDEFFLPNPATVTDSDDEDEGGEGEGEGKGGGVLKVAEAEATSSSSNSGGIATEFNVGDETRWPAISETSWEFNEATAMARGAMGPLVAPPWRVMLLSDGSVTRHLQLLTDAKIKVEVLRHNVISPSDLADDQSAPADVLKKLIPHYHRLGDEEEEAFDCDEEECNASEFETCLLYTSPSPRDATLSRMPSSA